MTLLRRILLPLTLLLVASTAGAQPSEADKATARNLAIEAQEALEAEDYETALDKFRRAEQLYHAPTLVLGMARAYVGLGKYVEARERYNEVIREKLGEDASDAFRRAVEDAKEEIQEIEDEIAWVVLDVEGPDEPEATLDGASVRPASLGVKRAVNPGAHVFRADGQGHAPAEKRFDIVAGETKEIAVTLEERDEPLETPPAGPDAGEDDGTLGIIGWTALGVGAAGLVIGGVTGGLAIGKHGELEESCDDQGRCPAEQRATLDDFETLGTVSTVGFVVGGALAAAGVVIVVVDATGDEAQEPVESAMELEVRPAGMTATWRF